MTPDEVRSWQTLLPDNVETRLEVCEECGNSDGDFPAITCGLVFREVKDADARRVRQPCAVKLGRMLAEPLARCPHGDPKQRDRWARAVCLPRREPARPYITPAQAIEQKRTMQNLAKHNKRGKREKHPAHRVTAWNPGPAAN